MRGKLLILALVLAVLVEPALRPAQNRPGPRPAVWKDQDTASIPEPAEFEETLQYDFFYATFGQAPLSFVSRLGKYQPAWNVNAWDEVPDSSWYTNRHHLHPMTPEEVYRGPNQGPGPDLSGPFVILRGKEAGTSPGLGRARDARGKVYFIKFDGADSPELSTAAEIIGSRFFHAMGFHVPEEWIIYLRRDQMQIDPQARIWDQTGRRRKMTQADVEEMLKGVARTPDGRYRAVASLQLPGIRDKGGFQFYGTRKDDPNDLIPHHHRRELRGLRLLCAWINHYDIRVGNTKDMYVEEEGRKFLRHYLLDFGSTLGSASYFPKVPRMGFSYVWDTREMSGPFLSLGLYQPRWREHPAPIQYASVGRFESEMFSPARWKPVLPLISFDYMDAADAFWGGKIVMSFTEEHIRAAVRAGRLSDPKAEELVVRTLLERQRKIGRYAFTRVNPLDRFQISTAAGYQQLEFQDLALKYGFADAANTWYYYTLSALGDDRAFGPIRSTRGPRIPLDELFRQVQQTGRSNSLFALTIGTRRAERDFLDRWVRVFLEREASGFRLRGWERE